jgi:C1A family cysteine protease
MPTGFKGTTRTIARCGWKPDLPDQRDFSYAVPAHIAKNLPKRVDLRDQRPEVYDQGRNGSYTANAIAAALEFDMMKEGKNAFTPSRLFIYYNERAIEGTVGSDAGAQIRDSIKSVARQGDCPESEWPYDDTPAGLITGLFPVGAKATTPPPESCYGDAVKHYALAHRSVSQNLSDMKGCLASGYPFVYGFTVYNSFESPEVRENRNVPSPPGESVFLDFEEGAMGVCNCQR